ncbi:hypothetical protein [Virgisporangium aurantiacum]|nr:hypothetical protein [Virgisporangium aurantiacum]
MAEMLWMFALIAVAAATLTLGFMVGFVTFKRSRQWCPGCGAVLRCPECPRHPMRHPALSIVETRTS